MKQKNIKLKIIILAFIMLLPSISLTRATVTGDWDTCTSDHYQVFDGNSPLSPLQNIADFDLGDVNSFSGINITWTINAFEKAPIPEWAFSNELNFYYTLKLTGFTGESYYIQGQFREYTTWFGIADNWYRETHKTFYPSNHTIDSVGVWYNGTNTFNLHLNRYDFDLLFTYEDSPGVDFGGALFHDNRTATIPEDWYNTVAITLYVGWAGQGSFDINFAYSTYQNTDHSTVAPAVGFSEIPPTGIIGFLIGIKDMFITVGAFFAQLVYGLIPLLPIIFFSYLTDAVLTSISQRSFTPIGRAFMFLWDKAVDFFDMLMNTLDAIIPF